jgi:kynurenine formamidase
MEPHSTEVRGALSFITPELIRGAAGLVKRGQVIPLNTRIDDPNPPVGRPAMRRTVRMHNSRRPAGRDRFVLFNDDLVEFALQGSSHLDAFAHLGLVDPEREGVFYGDRPLTEVHPEPLAKELGIDAFGGAIVTRGILIDLVAGLGRPSADYLADGRTVTKADVEHCLKQQGAALGPGDAVLLFTGFEARREESGGTFPELNAGVDGSTMELWRGARISLLASDNLAVERYPGDYSVHIGCLRDAGIPLGELWSLGSLASACRADGDYEFLLVSVPLNIFGAFGSPANAVAIR